MSKDTTKTRVQCKACPWRKDVVPERDITGGYCERRHEALRETIAEPGSLRGLGRDVPRMACHESGVGSEVVCVGWLANQLGPGNNLALRLQMASGRLPGFRIVGEQHERFQDTLPKRKRKVAP